MSFLEIFTSSKFLGTIVLLHIVFTLVWLWMRYNYSYWKRQKIPYIEPTPFFGNIKNVMLMKKCFTDKMQEMYDYASDNNKPAVGIYIFHRPCLLLRDLDLVKRVLIKDFNKFSNRFAASDPHSDPLGADNLFFVKNPMWKHIRVKITPVFTSGKMKQMFPLVDEIGCQLDAHLTNLTRSTADKLIFAEIKDICTLFSTDVIASVAYGVQANSMSNPNGIFRTNGKRIFDYTIRRGLELNCMFFLPRLVKFLRFKVFSPETTKFLRDVLTEVLNDRLKSGVVRNDLIDLLINFKREAEADKEKKHFILEGDSLIAQAAIFFSAGFETTSSTMSVCLHELAKQPELQHRLRDEIRDILERNDGVLSYDCINEMPFLNNVIQETLRLYPIMSFVDRECTLNPGEKSYSFKPQLDFEVPQGMPIYIPIYSLHRDENHFPEPNRFNPDRFSPEEIKNNNMSAYMPFGTGPHNCIGERFGLMTAKIGIVNFLRNHYVEFSEKTVADLKFNSRALLLNTEGGLHLKIVNDPLI